MAQAWWKIFNNKKSSLLRADDSPLSVLRQTVFHDYDKFVIPQEVTLREVFKKSKWKFKMAFAIRRPPPPP